jgi:hypothetical protein
MHRGRTTLSKFLIEQLSDSADHSQLAGLLIDVTAAIKGIAAMTAKGALGVPPRGPVSGVKSPTPLETIADEEILRSCEWGGLAAGLGSKRAATPHAIPADYKRGKYLLLFDPLAGAANFDVNMSLGTLFSVLHHDRGEAPDESAWLRPGRALLAAGYAIYGPATMLVLSAGAQRRQGHARLHARPRDRQLHPDAPGPQGSRGHRQVRDQHRQRALLGAAGPALHHRVQGRRDRHPRARLLDALDRLDGRRRSSPARAQRRLHVPAR